MKLTYATALLLAAAAATGTAGARTLTPEEALGRAEASAAGNGGNGPAKARARLAGARLAHTARTQSGDPAVYVFENAKDGYILVSADDCAYPVLGYSDNGSIPADTADMAPALRWWLDEYARQIDYAAARGLDGSAPMRRTAGRKAIEPMLKTSWDQGDPYNRQCPSYGADRTFTGCVATSMAQVLNYWKYPEKGIGSISYNAATIQKRLSLNFALRKFDWGNMISTYRDGNYTDAEADAVAYLMKACGYAVRMDYGTDSSGALAMYIPQALKKYFGYDGNLSYEVRHFYTGTQWDNLIYDNLLNVGPVLYGGGSMIGGGHSFVCDGYDGEGYYHFNWGWTAMSDGYFSLDALNPYALGTGGGTGGGYNFTQDAVLGIQPPTGKPVEEHPAYLTQQGSLAGVVNGTTLSFDLFAEGDCMWVNYNPETMNAGFEALIECTSDPSVAPQYVSISNNRFAIEPGYGTNPQMLKPALDLSTVSLADGTYRLTVVTYDYKDESSARMPVRPCAGYVNYITLTKAGDTYTVTNNDVDRLEVTAGSIKGDYYYGMAARVSVTVANDSDIEMTRGFAPCVISQGKPVLLGESIMLTLKPGEKVTREWTTDMYVMVSNFYLEEDLKAKLTFYDEVTANFYTEDLYADFTVHVPTSAPSIITTGKPKLPGAGLSVGDTGNGRGVIYVIDDPTKIDMTCELQLNSGIFGYQVYGCICESTDQGMAIREYGGNAMFFEKPGERQTFRTTLNYPAMTPGKAYMLMMGFGYNGGMVQIGPDFTYISYGTSGVDDIEADGDSGLTFNGRTVTATADAPVTVYTVGGATAASGTGSVDVSALAPGIYIARSGAASLKIAIR